MPTDFKIGWTAGMIDGEGSICIARRKRKTGRIHHDLQIQICMTDEPTVDHLQELWGGSICFIDTSHYGNGTWKDQFKWIIASSTAEEVLRVVLPHLVTKKPQAELALEFRQTIGVKGKRVTPETFAIREEYHHRLRKLNRKGRGLCQT